MAASHTHIALSSLVLVFRVVRCFKGHFSYFAEYDGQFVGVLVFRVLGLWFLVLVFRTPVQNSQFSTNMILTYNQNKQRGPLQHTFLRNKMAQRQIQCPHYTG